MEEETTSLCSSVGPATGPALCLWQCSSSSPKVLESPWASLRHLFMPTRFAAFTISKFTVNSSTVKTLQSTSVWTGSFGQSKAALFPEGSLLQPAVSLLSWQCFYLVTVWDSARQTADKGFFVGLLLWVSQVASHCADSVGQEGWRCETDWGSICVWGGKFEADVLVMSWLSFPKKTLKCSPSLSNGFCEKNVIFLNTFYWFSFPSISDLDTTYSGTLSSFLTALPKPAYCVVIFLFVLYLLDSQRC